MKRTLYILVPFVALFTLAAIGLPWHLGPNPVLACGWGDGGGQGYVPQRQDGRNEVAARPPLTEEQARQIINEHVTRLNPDLKVGPLSDAGALYEAEILSRDNEVVQVLGVDKRSWRLVLIN